MFNHHDQVCTPTHYTVLKHFLKSVNRKRYITHYDVLVYYMRVLPMLLHADSRTFSQGNCVISKVKWGIIKYFSGVLLQESV